MRQLYFILFLGFSLQGFSQSLRDLYQEGLTAYEEENFEIFLEKMQTIDEMRPNYPAVVYNLAGAYALTGDSDKSIKTLRSYILMDATQDFSKDSDFESILLKQEFAEIQKMQQELTQTIDFEKAHEWELNASHPESITYHEKSNSYFVGGVRDGNIWRIMPDNEPKLWAQSPKNSWSVMGLEISPDGKELWVCTSSMTNYDQYSQNEDGFASVLKYDTKSGKLLNTYPLAGGHNFGDLVIDDQGNVFISDGVANKLYWISAKTKEMELFLDLSQTVYNLQGLSFDDNQSNLYVSDYIDGIYKIELATKQVVKVKVDTEGVLLKGIDGLYYRANALIGLHNGSKPNRIRKYTLSEDGNVILEKETLAQAGILGEPSQGVFVKNKLYFISNSPWADYDQDGNFNPANPMIIIGRLN